ncbi:hypothetical protein EV1_039464 [Malus domestica]
MATAVIIAGTDGVDELYGSDAAGILLSVLSRLFTVYLQMHGFTCGVDDLLVMPSKDTKMKEQLESCEEIGEKVFRDFIEVEDDKRKDLVALQLNIEKFIRSNGESALAALDRRIISQLNNKTSNSDVFKQLLLKGLSKPSVKNCIYLMTTSGAKGSVVVFEMEDISPEVSAYLEETLASRYKDWKSALHKYFQLWESPEIARLRGQVAAQGDHIRAQDERMNMIVQALAMSGLQIPTMPAPNVAPPSTSQPFRPDDTE